MYFYVKMNHLLVKDYEQNFNCKCTISILVIVVESSLFLLSRCCMLSESGVCLGGCDFLMLEVPSGM